MVGVYLGTRGENVAECLEVVGREIGELAAGRFDDDELQRAKDSMTGRLALAMESTGARMNRLGKALVTNGELLDEAEVAERVERVTADDIVALAAELYDPANLCAAGHRPGSRGLRRRRRHPGGGRSDAVTRVAVAGASGRLGGPICTAVAAADDLALAARIAPSLAGAGADAYGDVAAALAAADVDVLVDVTRPECVEPHVRLAIDAGVPVVLCTTGYGDDVAASLDAAARAAGVQVFYAPNFAVTAVLMMRLAVEAARHVPDCEIVEEHAATKLDRPSGTALHTARLIAEAHGARAASDPLAAPAGSRRQPVGASSARRRRRWRSAT